MYKTIIVVSCRVVRQLFGRGKPAPDKMPRFTFRRNKVQRPPCGREAHAHFRSSRNIRGKSPARSALSGRMKPKINKTEPSKKQEGNGAIRAPGANLTRAFRAGVGRDRKNAPFLPGQGGSAGEERRAHGGRKKAIRRSNSLFMYPRAGGALPPRSKINLRNSD